MMISILQKPFPRNKQMRFFSVVVLSAMSISAFSQDTNPKQNPRAILEDFIDQEARMLEALKATKSEAELVKLNEAVSGSHEKMTELAEALSKLGPFDDRARRNLWSIRATREYELLGNTSMIDELEAAPAELRPKIMQVFEGSMKQLQDAEESLLQSLKKDYPGAGRERIRVHLEGEFVATIGTAHQKDPFSDPAIAITFSVQADQLDGSSVVLFDQVIPWTKDQPNDDVLTKWIAFSKQKRQVTFTYPSGAFTYLLPTMPKRPAEADDSVPAGSRAKPAFESVKKMLADKGFDDPVALLTAMKPGFSDMKAFLELCDEGLASDDEVTRSTAYLCIEALNALRQSGSLSKFASVAQLSHIISYQWKNGEVMTKFATDENYRTQRFSTYFGFQERAQEKLKER